MSYKWVDKLLLFVAIILAIIYCAIGVLFLLERYFTQDIDAHIPKIEQALYKNTGLKWEIHGLDVEWKGLNPVIAVERLTAHRSTKEYEKKYKPKSLSISSQADNAVIDLSNAKVYLDFFASLFAAELRLYELEVADLIVRLSNVDGKWFLFKPQNKQSQPINLNQFIYHLQYAELNHISLVVDYIANTQHAKTGDSIIGSNFIDGNFIDNNFVDNNPVDSSFVDNHFKIVESKVLPAIKMQLRRANKSRQFYIGQFTETIQSVVESTEQAVALPADPLKSVMPLLSAWSENRPIDNNFSMNAYINSGSQEAIQWVNTFATQLNFDVLDTELWIEKTPDENTQWFWRMNEVAANFIQPNAERFEFNNVALEAQQNISGITHVTWGDFPFDFGERGFDIPAGSGELLFDKNHLMDVSISTAELDLAKVTNLVIETQLLPKKYLNIVKALDAKGKLFDLSVRFPGLSPASFKASGRLHDGSIKPRKNTPGGRHLDGHFELSALGGAIDVVSDDAFMILLPEVYHQPLSFSSAYGRVTWKINRDRFFIFSDNIQASSDDGLANFGASFEVNGRMRGSEANYMRLEIGVRNSNVEDLLSYIPHTVPASLSNWISQSNGAGEVIEGAFIYNGSLRGSESQYRNIQVYADVVGTSLQFDPDWREVNDISGLILVSEAQTKAHITEGKVGDLILRDAVVTIDTTDQKQGIAVDLALEGDTGGLITLLQNSPVGKNINSVIGSWSASGPLSQGAFSLKAPLSDITTNNIHVDFSAVVENTHLNMKNFDLSLDSLSGPIRYSSVSGLSSKGMSASLWNQPLKLSIGQYHNDKKYSNNDKPDAERLKINAAGQIDTENLFHWLEQPAVGFATGVTNFELALDYSEQYSQLHITSDLIGIAMSAPAPFYKVAQTPRLFDFNWDMGAAFQPMNIQLGKEAVLKFAYHDYNFLGGTVLLADSNESLIEGFVSNSFSQMKSSGLYSEGGITFTGSLSYFNLEEWRKAVTHYDRFDSQLSGNNIDSNDESSSFDIWGENLEISRALVFDKEINNLVASFSEKNKRWSFQLESDLFKGLIQLPIYTTDNTVSRVKDVGVVNKSSKADVDATSIRNMPVIPNFVVDADRMIIDLDYLRLSPQGIDSSANSINEFDESFLRPASLSSMKVNIDQFYIGSQPYGQWRFLLTAGDNAALIHDIKASAFSLELFSDVDDGLLWAEDSYGAMTTSLDLQVSSSDFGGFLKFVQKENENLPMVSEELNADLSLSWSGAPDAMTITGLTGDIDFEFGRGRFFQASQSATGILKILGLINFDTLVRRIQLDFADIYKEGLSFDKITGQLHLDQNRIEFLDKPIDVKAPSSKFSMLGAVNLEDSTIDADLVATLPVANNLPWIAALAAGLPVAAGTFIVTRVFGDQFEKFSQANYHIGGSLDDPEVTFDRVFEDAEPNDNKTDAKQDTDLQK